MWARPLQKAGRARVQQAPCAWNEAFFRSQRPAWQVGAALPDLAGAIVPIGYVAVDNFGK
jgi:hypothetical protein